MKSTSTKTMKSLTLIVFFQFVLFVSMGFAAEDEKKVHFDFYYAVDYSQLNGSAIDLWGASIKDEEVTSVGSKAGFKYTWGDAWLQQITLDAYSTHSAFPSNFGRGDKELSLTSLAAFFGQNIGRLPVLGFQRVEFLGVGVVNGTTTFFDGNRIMSKGEEFDLGITFDTLKLTWRMGNIGTLSVDKDMTGGGFEYGIGAARMEYLGVKRKGSLYTMNSTISQKNEGYGAVVTMNLRYGTMAMSKSTNLYFQANGDIIATSIGGMIKTGYETGLLMRIGKNIALNPYVGGYLWLIREWGSKNDDTFDGLSTDVGYSAGLQITAKF